MNLSRRAVLAGFAATMAAGRAGTAWADPIAGVPRSGDKIVFDVLFGRSRIGVHEMVFDETVDQGLRVHNRIDVAVSVAGLKLFYYRHTSTETYTDGRLVQFVGETDDDGDLFNVSGEAVADGFRSMSDKGPVMAPADILVASYWNPVILSRKILLDPQKGRIREQVVEQVEPTTVTVFGKPRKATMYQVAGIADGDIYYDTGGEWVAARLVRRGTDVTYRRRV